MRYNNIDANGFERFGGVNSLERKGVGAGSKIERYMEFLLICNKMRDDKEGCMEFLQS